MSYDIILGCKDTYFKTENLIETTMLAAIKNGVDIKSLFESQADKEDINNVLKPKVQNGILMLSIEGMLYPSRSWITDWLKIPTYQGIVETLNKHGSNKAINGVLMIFDSPGGLSKRLFNTTAWIREFNNKVKPVIGYTADISASAAYALMSAGSQLIMDKDAQVGSIGSYAVHTEYSKMNEKLGITKTVFRSAELKGIGNEVEPLSEAAKEQIQKQIDKSHNKFVETVAEMREMSVKKVNDNLATGEMFDSGDAKKLGLVDQVLSLDATVDRLARYFQKRQKA